MWWKSSPLTTAVTWFASGRFTPRRTSRNTGFSTRRQGIATLLELRDGEYVEWAVLDADATLTTPLLPGLAIPLADVFRHRRGPAQ